MEEIRKNYSTQLPVPDPLIMDQLEQGVVPVIRYNPPPTPVKKLKRLIA